MKAVWTEEKTQTLIQWWPHWGVKKLAEMLGFTKGQVKAKVDHLRLKMLPQPQRLCIQCQKNKQSKRVYGFFCRKCYLQKRMKLRRSAPAKPRREWMMELLRTLKYRSIKRCGQESNLDIDFLLALWQEQDGKCFFSGQTLKEPVYYGRGRNWDIASIDRLDPSLGYIKGNVAWCCWGCNSGKSDFQLNEYLNLCKKIADNQQNILNKLENPFYTVHQDLD